MDLDNGSVIGALFIDFEKAFDTIKHLTLRNEAAYGGNIWNCYSLLMNYLADGQRYIKDEGAVSNFFFFIQYKKLK